MNREITYIDVDKIFPHPRNPRGDVGDITELTESIRANGIYQNLTVVPFFSITNPKFRGDGRYTVVIGHRRLAAAKEAGLKQVPCIISDMDEKEQVATMLLENMQRSDLTIYEQAQGFQMMFDLGESIDDIAAKTGFSKTTIKNRTNLLKLDQDKLRSAQDRGATLQELCELNAIDDVDLRNKVLDSVGTRDFRFELNKAKDKEIIRKNKPYLIEQLQRFAVKIESISDQNIAWVGSYHVKDSVEPIKIPDDAGHVRYYWYECGTYIYLYKDRIKTLDQMKQDEKNEQIRLARDKLNELSKTAYQLRRSFMENYPGRKRDLHAITDTAASLFWMYTSYIDINDDFLIFLLKCPEDADQEEYEDYIRELYEQEPERTFACMVYSALEGEWFRYYDFTTLQHRESEILNAVYDFLEKLGYEISDEELSLKNGTHILFTPGDDKTP